MKDELTRLLSDALKNLADILPGPVDPSSISIEHSRDPSHGDYASNIALRLARPAQRRARELAEAIVAALPPSPLLARAEVAGAGFINFHLVHDAHAAVVLQVLQQGTRYGASALGNGEKVLLEFVSANPTGPLHVGHG
ncbi:MAG: arginine--tRNA ligase, partial [Steroidobacteraceae bacterium]